MLKLPFLGLCLCSQAELTKSFRDTFKATLDCHNHHTAVVSDLRTKCSYLEGENDRLREENLTLAREKAGLIFRIRKSY